MAAGFFRAAIAIRSLDGYCMRDAESDDECPPRQTRSGSSEHHG